MVFVDPGSRQVGGETNKLYPEDRAIHEWYRFILSETLGKTSGFEKLYGKVTRLYFGGMARHLAFLRPALRPGAHLAYVVGDQASYFRVMIATGKLLAEVGESLGYETVGIDLFRTRFSTATKEQLNEEVVMVVPFVKTVFGQK